MNAKGTDVTPSLAHIADFSSISGDRPQRVRASIDATRNLLGGWIGQVQFVDVVVEEPPKGA
jgi:hypothetical protein